ncbi:hypothetical protein RRG08_058182 [Elysia crispata]|uniref:Uncharacterized protein n=1 Tax=Elysia crispata TaxID=231223 RepID=A0AAE0Y9I5_9GAST|nr:hypothetical protein RRG08_058182 [Elysia crispata]
MTQLCLVYDELSIPNSAGRQTEAREFWERLKSEESVFDHCRRYVRPPFISLTSYGCTIHQPPVTGSDMRRPVVDSTQNAARQVKEVSKGAGGVIHPCRSVSGSLELLSLRSETSGFSCVAYWDIVMISLGAELGVSLLIVLTDVRMLHIRGTTWPLRSLARPGSLLSAPPCRTELVG